MSGRPALLGLCVMLCGGAALAGSSEFTGYWKSFVSVTDVRDSYRRLGLTDDDYLADAVERVRLKLQYAPAESVAFGAHYEARAHWGDSVTLRRRLEETGAGDALAAPERRRFMELEGDIVDEDFVTVTHGFDRLWARIEPDRRVQLTAGRQAVSWGTGLIWNPMDLFAAFSPTEIDREEKLGVDVARLVVQALPGLSVDVVAEPLDLDEHWTMDAEDSSLAARLGTHVGEYDLHLCGGSVQSDMVLGGDFVGYLADAGFRGEALYTWTEEGDQRDYFRGLLGLDYSFAARWDPYVALEYFHNGLGTDDPDDYAARRMETSVRRVFERGIAYNVGREYVGGTLRLQPSALVTVQSMTLANLLDGSLREFATLGWSMSESSDLILGADFGFGRPSGEFTGWKDEDSGVEIGVPDLYYLYLKYYF